MSEKMDRTLTDEEKQAEWRKERGRRAIQSVLAQFNFAKVQMAMLAVGWFWGNPEDGTPSIREMRDTARELLTRVVDRGHGFASTGGFHAEIDHDGDLSLTFQFEEADANVQKQIY